MLLCMACLIGTESLAKASWLIDPFKFHVSVHRQNSCLDCHEEIAELKTHPNPASVNKKQSDSFRVEKCLLCHDQIMENLDKGLHGSRKVQDADTYRPCLGCHHPHYQPPLGEDRGRFDPKRAAPEQCGACHDHQAKLPIPSKEDAACISCHHAAEAVRPEHGERIKNLCLHCHARSGTEAQEITGRFVPLINEDSYQSTPHYELACTACHPQAARFNHSEQQYGNCGQCHLPHHEKKSHDAHVNVSCQACHLKSVRAVRDAESKCILWEKERPSDGTSVIHDMTVFDKNAVCQRCHVTGNQLGAASMNLPPKSVLCMPCHAATFSWSDTVTVPALIIFLAGIVTVFSYYLSGSMTRRPGSGPAGKVWGLFMDVVRAVFSFKIFVIVKALVLDVLFQRRLYRQSPRRWAIHSLIFFPFVFRFSWGIISLVGSIWKPDKPFVWDMVNKNFPLTAFLFDLTGAMVLAGLVLAFQRGRSKRPSNVSGLPTQDRLALSLIAAVIVIGFILEGMRIAMTGWPEGVGYAFLGYVVSLVFSSPERLTGTYGYVWYAHAILTGVFIAYLPFSRLLHIIMAPVVLAVNAVSGYEHKKEERKAGNPGP